VTFGRYWNPSFLPGLHIPFVWGPVGGGESAPKAYWSAFGWKGRLYETLRDLARRVGEQDPFVRQTARHCKVGLPTTFETAARLRHLGVQELIEVGNAALNHQDIEALGRLPDPPNGPIRFVSMGRLLHWKGFHLGLQAFAAADLPEAEYWIIGDGSDRPRLESLACSLGIAGRVRFTGNVSRTEAMQLMAQCHALVHPSLHDSGGWVCIEALAAGRSVLCLDLGGPALLVNQENGFKVSAQDPEQSIRELVEAMQILAKDDVLRERMGKQARIQAAERFTWASKAEQIGDAYRKAVGDLSVSKSVSANRPSALIQTESTLLPVSTP
jgi:glycosyltransferase involved in cell wall biosynthesis